MSKRLPEHMALSADGRQLPYSPTEIQQHVIGELEFGAVLAVVLVDDTTPGVIVFGPPTLTVVRRLRQAADAYERFLTDGVS